MMRVLDMGLGCIHDTGVSSIALGVGRRRARESAKPRQKGANMTWKMELIKRLRDEYTEERGKYQEVKGCLGEIFG